jgi:hypothetical protein
VEGFIMGFLDFFKGSNAPKTPTVLTILPLAAVSEIQQGRLPQLNTTTIFLKKGEICHYIDKAILLKEKTKRSVVRTGGGYSMPGLFKGTRVNMNRTRANFEENTITEQFRGILYITNKRVIFQAAPNGFEKSHGYLTSIAPYSNAVDLQYGSTIHSLIVPDGTLIHMVITLIKS